MIHLHANGLVGNADYFNYSVASFITDCGLTEISSGLTTCEECTECCNVEGGCITVAETWPKNHIKSLGVSPALLIMGFSIVFSFVLIRFSAVFSIFSKYLPRLPYVVRQEFQQDSSYRWFLSTYKSAWFWGLLSLAFQLWLVLVFLQSGDYTSEGNLWLYSKDCPEDDTVCYEQKTTNLAGWLTFVAILAVFLLQDLIPGMVLLYESSVDFNWKGLFAGLAIMNVTILSAVASAIFIYATSLSNIVIYMNAVIVLFLNSIDEQVFMIIQRVAPGWADDVEADIMNPTMDMLTQEISEIEDDDDADVAYMPDQGDFDFKEVYDSDDHMPKDYDSQNGKENGDCDIMEDKHVSSQVDFEAMKQQLIAEVTGIYDADKAKFMAAHKADADSILEELKQVKVENEADKARILEELKQMKEENKALKDAVDSGKGVIS
jgi:hypothetical protein